MLELRGRTLKVSDMRESALQRKVDRQRTGVSRGPSENCRHRTESVAAPPRFRHRFEESPRSGSSRGGSVVLSTPDSAPRRVTDRASTQRAFASEPFTVSLQQYLRSFLDRGDKQAGEADGARNETDGAIVKSLA